MRNAIASTDDDRENDVEDDDDEEGEDEYEDPLEADYGNESNDAPYEFEKNDGEGLLDLEQKKDKGGIFDKKESDSDVEEYLEDLENDEMELDGLKLPSDDDEDEEEDEDGPGLNDYDDEEDFGEGIRDDYEDSDGGDARQMKGDSQDGEEDEDNEAELDDVFAQANKNQEMDVVENLRR